MSLLLCTAVAVQLTATGAKPVHYGGVGNPPRNAELSTLQYGGVGIPPRPDSVGYGGVGIPPRASVVAALQYGGVGIPPRGAATSPAYGGVGIPPAYGGVGIPPAYGGVGIPPRESGAPTYGGVCIPPPLPPGPPQRTRPGGLAALLRPSGPFVRADPG